MRTLMTMQSSDMHDQPRRVFLRTSSTDSPPSYSPRKRLSRAGSTTMVLSSDPFRYSTNICKDAVPSRVSRGVLTRATTISAGMLLPNRNVMTPPIKVDSVPAHPRRLVKQKTFAAPDCKYSLAQEPEPHSSEKSDLSSMSTSCPNLADEEELATVPCKTPVRHCKSSDGRLSSPGRREYVQQSSTRLLTVPNIFTTSQTRSQPEASRSTHSAYRHSAPELAVTRTPEVEGQLKRRPHLAKAFSDTPARSQSHELLNCDSDTDPNKPRYAKVLDYLYIGNSEAVDNERLMCRLGITSIVNLGDGEGVEQEGTSLHNSRWPCPCGSDTRHLKATLRLQVSDADTTEFESYMDQINKFIEGAKKVNKKVLVQCVTGNSLSVVAVMQYLMAFRRMNLRKAYSMVMKTMSDLYIPPMYKEMLQRQEKLLLSPEEQSLCFDRTRASGPLPMEAWTSSPTPPLYPDLY